jgi:hypothetical protein
LNMWMPLAISSLVLLAAAKRSASDSTAGIINSPQPQISVGW